MTVDELNPSENDVKQENETVETADVEIHENDESQDNPQHEENSDASNIEGTEPEADEKPVEEQPPRKSKTSKRFQELANRAKAAEERARQAEESLAQLSQQQESADFDEYDVNDVIKRSSHETAKILQEQTAKQAREELARTQEEQIIAKAQVFQEAEVEFASKVSDYQEAINGLQNLPQNQAVANLILESDKGPELAYYLGKNPNEAHAVVNMQPLEAAKYIGGIEARLTPPAAKKATTAPKPVPKVGGVSGSSSKDPASMTMKEYEKWRMGNS